MRTAVNLKIGEKGIIKGFKDVLNATKFLSMGLRPNDTIKIIRRSPLGNNIYIQHNRQFLALRNVEAECIEII